MKYFFLLLILLLGFTGFYFFYSILFTDNTYVFPLDDAYIHLAIAKNFSEHGNWSINNHGFESASSSIYYTFLLSILINIFGNCQYISLILNIILGSFTLFIYTKFFKDFYDKEEQILATVLVLPFSLLYVMVLQGMEHTLHMLLMVSIFYCIEKYETESKIEWFYIIVFFVFLNALARYESMFFTIVFAFILMLRKEVSKATIIIITGFLPIIIFGVISVNNGGFFFPNSVIVKGNFPKTNNFILLVLNYLEHAFITYTGFWKWLFFPFTLIIFDCFKSFKKEKFQNFLKEKILALIVLISGVLHIFFAVLEYRYENYLMIASLLVLVPIMTDFYEENRKKMKYNFQNVAMGISFAMVFMIATYRLVYQHIVLSESSKNIYRQQIQMSKFLHEFYQNEIVAANDIGAISYFSNVNLLDLTGLGSTDVARFEKENQGLPLDKYQEKKKKFITEFTKNHQCKIAVIYNEWFENSIPENWISVASWTIEKGFGPARKTVFFYATDKNEAIKLKKNLEKFKLNKNATQVFLSNN